MRRACFLILNSYFLLSFIGCAETPAKADSFINSEAGKSLTKALAGAVFEGGLNVAVQYGTTGKIDPHKVVLAAYDGSAALLRQVDPKAVNALVVKDAVADGAGVPVVSEIIAPIISRNINRQILEGTPPGVAVENAAATLNEVAASFTNGAAP